ncbi:MAG: DUF58 domain-containing protein [Desulfurellaceae bacterium]|nr:DUF58 domain-containing protein [Desulfurellaceae bacterium]
MASLDSAFFKTLNRFHIRVRTARGHRPGETPIPRTSQASGIEFESFKEYSPGDDFRYLDWNAVGRLGQLMVRTFTAEREIPFHLFLDTSASMGVPTVDDKFSFALDVMSALSYVVLANNNTLRLIALSAPDTRTPAFRATPFLRHRSRFFRLRPFLDSLSASGKTTLQESVRAYIGQTLEPGVAIIISDFMTPAEQYTESLAFLKTRGYEVKAVHVLGAAELDPRRLFRRGKLHDVEDGAERWITLSEANLGRYQELLQAHLDAVRDFCHQHQILYSRVSTRQTVSQVVSHELTRTGLLALR